MFVRQQSLRFVLLFGDFSMSTSGAAGSPPEIPPEQLKLAYKAFKKRLKLTRLDSESKLGVGPLSSGGGWGVVGITPPHEYPKAVWDELVRQGKLKNMGDGLYTVVGQ